MDQHAVAELDGLTGGRASSPLLDASGCSAPFLGRDAVQLRESNGSTAAEGPRTATVAGLVAPPLSRPSGQMISKGNHRLSDQSLVAPISSMTSDGGLTDAEFPE